MLKDAASKGIPLSTQTVRDNVSVEAVLLPANVCKKVFGKEIANNYAAVELTISNRSLEQSLLVHSIFIDYSRWALSGSQYLDPKDTSGNPQESWQAATNASQISSVEYRVARGELLDAQQWTTRNWVMRALTAAGAIATAYSFSISEQGIVRGIAAFSGQVVPAAETFWPDGTIGQMNRISDVGFQTNKAIPKNASDIIVAFFPIDRFLTPGLKKLFLKSPALFFSPYALLLDPEGKVALNKLFANMLQGHEDLLDKLPLVYMHDYVACLDSNQKKRAPDQACDSKLAESSPEELRIIKFMAHASLNTIRIVVGGEMMVSVDRIPASITSIALDEGNDQAESWSKGDHTGIITGNYLKGGAVSVDEAKQVGNPTFKTDDENSTDQELHFTMTLPQDVTNGTQLTFRVSKKDKDGNPVQGIPYTFVVQYTPTAPTGDGKQQPSTTGGDTGSGTAAPASKDKKQTPATPAPGTSQPTPPNPH